MSVEPFPIQCCRDGKWSVVQTDDLVPGDVVSISTFYSGYGQDRILTDVSIARAHSETTVPADLLLIQGTCIVNEAMLSGESTPLLKESIDLQEDTEKLDMDGSHKMNVLFSGTKVLQAGGGGELRCG